MTHRILALCFLLLSANPVFSYGALDPGTANVTAYGGISPSYFGKKDLFRINLGTSVFNTPLSSFHDHFRFPFIFGASAGFSFTEDLDVNLSVDYQTARGDTHVFTANPNALSTAPGNTNFEISTGTYGSFGVYLGAKYYIDLGSCWYPFIGGRAGVQLRRATRATSFVNKVNVVNRGSFFKRNTVAAGGLSLGFDGPLTEYVNIFVMGEVNYSGGLESRLSIPHHVRIRRFRTHPLIVGLRFRAD